MTYTSYYDILGLPPEALTEQIKTAYRKLALKHHPDTNRNSPSSQARFILITNAYTILADPLKRKEYDTYLGCSRALHGYRKNKGKKKAALPGRPGETYRTNAELLTYLNYILWELEDLLRAGKTDNREPSILQILAFIDKWVLTPGGYPDYFSAARNLNHRDPLEYVKNINAKGGNTGHRPFVSVNDYFYDIRKRMDKFLAKTRTEALFKPLPGRKIRLIDSIMETQNYAVHYLSYLVDKAPLNPAGIPPFCHSQQCFQE